MTFQHVEAMLKPFQHLSTSGGSMVSVSKSVMAKVRTLQTQAKDSIFSTAFEGQTVFRLSNYVKFPSQRDPNFRRILSQRILLI